MVRPDSFYICTYEKSMAISIFERWHFNCNSYLHNMASVAYCLLTTPNNPISNHTMHATLSKDKRQQGKLIEFNCSGLLTIQSWLYVLSVCRLYLSSKAWYMQYLIHLRLLACHTTSSPLQFLSVCEYRV